MTAGFFYTIISFAGALTVISGTGRLFVMNRRRENRNLAALFCVIGILLLQVSVILYHGERMTWTSMYHASLLFSLGPLLLLAYNAVVFSGKALSPLVRVPVHPGVDLLYLRNGFRFDRRGNGLYLLDIMNGIPLDWNARVMLVFLVLACLQDVLYIFRFLAGIIPLARVTHGNIIVNWTIIFATGSLMATVSLGIAYLTRDRMFMAAGCLVTSMCMLGLYYLGQRYPHYLHIFKVQVKERKYRKSLLESYNVEDICQRLNALMSEGRIYRDENLSLKTLADLLDITPQQLSQLLNDKMKTSFHTYINNFRIEEATYLLLEDRRRSVLSIAYEVGFNTKSSFYDAFSRYTSKTPQQYRREAVKAEKSRP